VQPVRKSGSKSQPKAGGSEYLELHGAFSISLRAPGTEFLSKGLVSLPERDSAEEIAFGSGCRVALRPAERLTEEQDVIVAGVLCRQGRFPSQTASILGIEEAWSRGGAASVWSIRSSKR
jgi:hypothetical protein